MSGVWRVGRGRRAVCRPGLERLEARRVFDAATVPEIAMLAATTTDSQSIQFRYSIAGAASAPAFDVAFYRSADPLVDASSVLIGDDPIASPGDLTAGTHQLTATIAGGLPIDPARPYVLAVARGGQADINPAVASFRVYVIGAVTHGLELTPGLPPLVTQMANGLEADGYDATIPFDWSSTSRLRLLGQAAAAGRRLADQVVAAAETAAATLGPDDVIALHMIAHSRGSAVIDQAMFDIQARERTGADSALAKLAAGWTKLTFLDPHPLANAPAPNNASASSGPLGRLIGRFAARFQALAQDPPIVIPPGVSDVEVYYQRADHTAAPNVVEKIFIFWGVPIPGATHQADLTGVVNSHFEVPRWYLQHVVPTLKTASPFVSATAPTPAPASSAARSRASGAAYEVGLLVDHSLVSRRSVAMVMMRLVAGADASYARGRDRTGDVRLKTFLRYVNRQSGRTVAPQLASTLNAMVQTFILGRPHTNDVRRERISLRGGALGTRDSTRPLVRPGRPDPSPPAPRSGPDDFRNCPRDTRNTTGLGQIL